MTKLPSQLLLGVEQPEWDKYLKQDPETAGYLTHRESGYCVEIAQEATLQQSKNIWVDGSLRDSNWYAQVFVKIRRVHPKYRIAILHVRAKWETVQERAATRAKITGRIVPSSELRRSFEQVPNAVAALSKLADFTAHIDNDIEPKLSTICEQSECSSVVAESWEEVHSRFVIIPSRSGEIQGFRRLVEEMVAASPVVMFSKSYCSVCKVAKVIMGMYTDVLEVLELDTCHSQPDFVRKLDAARLTSRGLHATIMAQLALQSMSSVSTVPQIFVSGDFVGGCDELKRLHNIGELAAILAAALPNRSLKSLSKQLEVGGGRETAAASNFYDIAEKSATGELLSFDQFRGKGTRAVVT
eukprot:COSAG01_NODE_3470_length_6049_cov_689.357815_8_plen_356_part_00